MAYLYRLRSNRYRRLPGGAQPTDSYAATGFDQENGDWDSNMPGQPQNEFRNEMFDQLHSQNTAKNTTEHANLLENDQLDQT